MKLKLPINTVFRYIPKKTSGHMLAYVSGESSYGMVITNGSPKNPSKLKSTTIGHLNADGSIVIVDCS